MADSKGADALRERLRDEEERHALLQSRCYEGFASATDGIFDALRERDEQHAALLETLREIIADSSCSAYIAQLAEAAISKAESTN